MNDGLGDGQVVKFQSIQGYETNTVNEDAIAHSNARAMDARGFFGLLQIHDFRSRGFLEFEGV